MRPWSFPFALAALASCSPSDAADSTDSGTLGSSSTSPSDGSTSPLLDSSGSGSDDDRSPLCIALGDRCNDDVVTEPTIGEPVFIAPSSALPGEVVSQRAHNNLDVIWHDGRLYFAFRTAPNHFASPDTVMYVVSTEDLSTWSHEAEVALGTDVREPQFLSIGGELRFYFAVLGDSPTGFDPMGSRIMTRRGPGDWTDPEPVFEADFLPWRIKTYDDTVYVAGYLGGGAVYDPMAPPIEVQVLTTQDGIEWAPAFSEATVLVGGSSETDFVFTDEGAIVAVSRNEAGDELGFGMKVCRAEPNALAQWSCVGDPRKYDSPLLFRHGSRTWLIGRRNMTETGWYDLMDDTLTEEEKYWSYQLDYWLQPKRCSLWSVDDQSLAIEHVLDLPSRGDTCFPEIVELSSTQYLVFNYTSDLEGPDLVWQDGQLGRTAIYYAVLTMPPP